MTSAPTRIVVSGPDRYPVIVGRNVLDTIGELLSGRVERVLIIHQRGIDDVVRRVAKSVQQTGVQVRFRPIPNGEESKTAETLARLWKVLGAAGVTRSDAVVAVGGGAATDVGGFAAATWLRGVDVIHVPTTLLGMVDAAVGGKTGINIPEGKNLVGAFHPPAGVVCDLTALRTLPAADLVAGMAEVVKAGFIARPQILDAIEASPEDALRWDSDVLEQLVTDAVRVKADVVGADLKESYLREVLNYGHTFGHALEQVERYRRRHGEAVSVGMVFAAELGRRTGPLGEDVVERHRDILRTLGLPTTYPAGYWPQLLAAMGRDKKNRGHLMRFVVLAALAQPVRVDGPPLEVLEECYAAVSE